MTERYKYQFIIEPSSNPIILSDSQMMIGDDIALIRDDYDGKDTQITFSSVHLNELEDPVEVWNRGESLRRVYLGARTIESGYFDHPYRPRFYFRLTQLYKGEYRITPSNLEVTVPMYPFSSLELEKPWGTTSLLIHLSKFNKDILALLIQFGSGPGWINLYGILDTLKYYSKEKGIDIIEASNLEAEVKAFTGIANSFGLIGIEARHGERGWQIPQQVITLTEAIAVILKLTRVYLNIAHNMNLPESIDNKQEDSWGLDEIF